MNEVNEELQKYINEKIFPTYKLNDSAHNLKHINSVIIRCLKFKDQFDNIDPNMLYAIAAFHDVGHHIDKDNHEVLSAKIFYENEDMKKFFTEEQRLIIKEAIEDHRASLEYIPRSDYGKIVSSADRADSITEIMERTHGYTLKHYPNMNIYEMINRSHDHIIKKYGKTGYAKTYVKDDDYEKTIELADYYKSHKYDYAKKYMEVNNINEIDELAKIFAIEAHKGQIRKNEPEKPKIIHPISVAELLKEYGCDKNVIAAGYLHDVVEDTKYTEEDIEKEFGSDIKDLVMSATEPDKSLSWEERKQHTINITKDLPLRNKLLICADKINNLEDLLITFTKNDKRDFSAFKCGEEKQRWYYTSVYESLIHNEDPNHPMFKRLKDVIDKVFYNKENDYLKNVIFENNRQYDKLKILHAKKQELYRLKQLISTKPFVIEFSGTPRTGKTTTINNIYDFFKKGGFKVTLVEEFTTSKDYKEGLLKKLKDKSRAEINIKIVEQVYLNLLEAIKNNPDIILLDRSLNDRQIWNYLCYIENDMDEKTYNEVREKYKKLSRELIDLLIVTYADSLTCLKRDYISSLALEERSFLNEQNINNYNDSLHSIEGLLTTCVDDAIFFDTSTIDLNDTSYEISSQIIPVMKKKYLTKINNLYNK